MNGRPGHLHELFSLNGADDAGIGVLWWKRNMNQQRGAFTNISSLPSLCDQPSTTSPTHQLSPSYIPCMSGVRECKPRPALQHVYTHCHLLSLFAPTMCVMSALPIEWALTVNDVASLTSSCFPRSQVRPKCPGALCIIILSDPPQQAFIPLKSFPASHHTQEGTLSNRLETKWNISVYPSREREIRCIFTFARRLVTPLPGRVGDLISMTS